MEKNFYGFAIVTPEHLYAYFYGFDECTTIKKCSVSFHCRSACSIASILSLSLARRVCCHSVFCPLVHPTLDKHLHFNAMTHPTISITFNFHIMPDRFRSVSSTIFYSHFARYRFLGNCCIIIII